MLHPIAIDLEWRPLGAKFELVFLPVSGFPLTPTELMKMQGFLDRFLTAAASHWDLASEVFLQLEQLHGGDSRQRFARNAAKWIPEVGIGVWPARDPPTTWTREEFQEFLPGQKPRPLMYQVFRVAGSPSAQISARNTLLDVGAFLAIMAPKDCERVLQTAYDTFQPRIADPSINCYPFYVPLLERTALESARPEQIEEWLCGTSVYVRESFEDQGLLVVSHLPLRDLLSSTGATPVGGRESTWRIG